MHNLKNIRDNPDIFKKKISNRNVKINFDELLKLDIQNRETIQKKEKLEQEKKIISKNKDKKLFKESKKISAEIDDLEKINIDLSKKINPILNLLPNIALEEVPVGKDETFNKELKISGNIPEFNYQPKSHFDLGENLNLMDFDTATKTSGSRFVFLKGKLAELERAISNFMLDIHTKDFGYQEISPPLIVTEDTMFGTGQLPKFENDQFELKLEGDKKKYLIQIDRFQI